MSQGAREITPVERPVDQETLAIFCSSAVIDDGSARLMRDQVSVLAKEPFVVINLHSH